MIESHRLDYHNCYANLCRQIGVVVETIGKETIGKEVAGVKSYRDPMEPEQYMIALDCMADILNSIYNNIRTMQRK
jgi:hypothetical protein